MRHGNWVQSSLLGKAFGESQIAGAPLVPVPAKLLLSHAIIAAAFFLHSLLKRRLYSCTATNKSHTTFQIFAPSSIRPPKEQRHHNHPHYPPCRSIWALRNWASEVGHAVAHRASRTDGLAGPFNHEVTQVLRLANNNAGTVAFKVRTWY